MTTRSRAPRRGSAWRSALRAGRGRVRRAAARSDWEVVARAPRSGVAARGPAAARLLAAEAVGPGTLPAVAARAARAGGTPPRWPSGCRGARLLAGVVRRRRWPGCCRWRSSTAPTGIARVLGNRLRVPRHGPRRRPTCRALLDGYVDRIPLRRARTTGRPTSAGHPPGALLFFVALVRLGLGGDFAAGLVVTAAGRDDRGRGAGRRCGRSAPRPLARRAAPFLVLTPGRGVHGGLGRRGVRGRRRVGPRRAGPGRDAGPAALVGVVGARRAAARLLRDDVLRPAAARAPRRSRCCSLGAVVAAAAGRRGRGAGGGAGVRGRSASRGGRPTRCCASATGTASPRTGPASYWMWGNLAALRRLRRARCSAPASRVARRPARADRVASSLLAGGRGSSIVRRRPVPDEQGRGGADLAAVRAVAALSLRAAARALAALGAGAPGRSRALLVQHLLYTSW